MADQEKFPEEVFYFRDFTIPERMRPDLLRYVRDGIKPGRFLQAVICNNLSLTVAHADEENVVLLPAYMGFFYWHAPSECSGSKEKMEAWIEAKQKERDAEKVESWKGAGE